MAREEEKSHRDCAAQMRKNPWHPCFGPTVQQRQEQRPGCRMQQEFSRRDLDRSCALAAKRCPISFALRDDRLFRTDPPPAARRRVNIPQWLWRNRFSFRRSRRVVPQPWHWDAASNFVGSLLWPRRSSSAPFRSGHASCTEPSESDLAALANPFAICAQISPPLEFSQCDLSRA